jgi:hypothetical protein
VDLHVPVHRRLADPAWRLALGIEAVRQVGDRLLETVRDGREMLLVDGYQRQIGLGTETVRKIKRARSQFATPFPQVLGFGQRLCGTTRVLPQAPQCAID